MHLVEHVLHIFNFLLRHRLSVENFIVDEEFGVIRLRADHPLDELDSAVPLVVAAETLDLLTHFLEDLNVRLSDFQILFKDGLRILAELLSEVLSEVLHLLESGVVLALALLQGLGAGLKVLARLVEHFVFVVFGLFGVGHL